MECALSPISSVSTLQAMPSSTLLLMAPPEPMDTSLSSTPAAVLSSVINQVDSGSTPNEAPLPLSTSSPLPATPSSQDSNQVQSSPPGTLPTMDTSAVKTEPLNDDDVLKTVLEFLKSKNLRSVEYSLRKELNLRMEEETRPMTEGEASAYLVQYSTEGDPGLYEKAYLTLTKFIHSALECYIAELSMLKFPVLFHMYIQLVYNQHEQQATQFLDRFSAEQEDYYQDDLKELSGVKKRQHLKNHEMISMIRANQYSLRMSRETHHHFKRFMQENTDPILQEILKEKIVVDPYDGAPRSQAQVTAMSGSLCGEAFRQANKSKVYYGLLKEPDLQMPVEDDDETDEAATEKPKKKKVKKDPLVSRKSKNDPNAPPTIKVPLPELRDIDKIDRINALREQARRLKLGPNSLPSVCFFTFLNAHSFPRITSIEICEDSSMIAAGFSDSKICIWALTPNKLKEMKCASDLADIDKEADDVLVRMMDEKSLSDMKLLNGHRGSIYSLSFSPDRILLLSSSEDDTIRLWCLLTWSCLVVYRGHLKPVWDVRFSPYGYYFASCGFDSNVRVWTTDSYLPLRTFRGHLTSVDCVEFHPNVHYLASGSSDRSVRVWDMSTGNCVRHYCGHKATIFCLAFSTCGRFLVSGGGDKRILLWDLASGFLVAELKSHTETIYTLQFSRCGTILTSGGVDNCVKLWDFKKLTDEIDLEELNICPMPNVHLNTDGALLLNLPTKNTSVVCLHFTRRNMLMASGVYNG